MAIAIRDERVLAIGRQEGDRSLFLDVDVRRGRSFEQKREFALAVMDDAHVRFEISTANLKVVFTEHEGGI